MNTKIAFKSDGTVETGAKIINALKGLGGKNTQYLDGTNDDNYYFINENNIIDYEDSKPNGYHLNIDEPDPTFPRKMWCWDAYEEDGSEDEVLAIFPNTEHSYHIMAVKGIWKNAKELPKPNSDSDSTIAIIDEIKTMKATIGRILEDIDKLKTPSRY